MLKKRIIVHWVLLGWNRITICYNTKKCYNVLLSLFSDKITTIYNDNSNDRP